MRLHYLQHVSFEDLGNIRSWAEARGHEVRGTRLDLGEPLPSHGTFDWLVVMGGPMNVYEHQAYPWLVGEKEFIRESIAGGVRFLGVCLGAQLAADALGGKVTRNPQKEIGWFPVRLTVDARQSAIFRDWPEEFVPFHWHGDTFAIPPGAVRIAFSDACANQAFQYGAHAVGLQFHLDYSVEGISRMIRNCGDELTEQPTVQTREDVLACSERVEENRKLLYRLLDSLQG